MGAAGEDLSLWLAGRCCGQPGEGLKLSTAAGWLDGSEALRPTLQGVREDLDYWLAAENGLIARRDHPQLARAIDGHRDRGALVSVLPGVYSRPGEVDPRVRISAVMRLDPDAVLTGRAAALPWWRELEVPIVSAVRRRGASPAPGFRWEHRNIPAHLIVEVGRLRCTAPALTILHLIDELGGFPIDEGLRRGVCSLAELWEALAAIPGSPGNARRRRLLIESRAEPWSELEREGHVVLFDAGISGWKANLPVRVGDHTYYLDVGFEGSSDLRWG